MAAINKLTDHKCKATKPGLKPQKISDGLGLFLYVTPSGAKVWRMGYRHDGKEQTASQAAPQPIRSRPANLGLPAPGAGTAIDRIAQRMESMGL